MIAPLDPRTLHRHPTSDRRSRAVRRARRMVWHTFFAAKEYPVDESPSCGRLQAWVFTAWVVIATTAYGVMMWITR